MSSQYIPTEQLPSMGCPIEVLQNCTSESLPIENKPNHTVLYSVPIKSNVPEPHNGLQFWDKHHVKMPFSSQSFYTIVVEGVPISKSRWELIKQTLSKEITCCAELEQAILAYNPKYKNVWKFTSLQILFDEILEEEETNYFFQHTLPSIVQLALNLPKLVRCCLPHLKQNKNYSVSLSQQQISSLLANAFLCTFPHRNSSKKESEYSMFPDINFNRLYAAGSKTNTHVIEKLKCICHYFRRICSEVPKNVVTFTRQHISAAGLPIWHERKEKIGDMIIHVTSEGTIEDDGLNMLQVDFANKFVGGGVLGSGCVQEEIRFVISPELIISRLFTEQLKPNEALIITGCERFSKYKGYSRTFSWDGDYQDKTACDLSRRRKCTIVAIDALHFRNSAHQYMPNLIERELNKAYVGFRPIYGTNLNKPQPVATGNWGCGAFGGDATLKALLQIMAARIVKRNFAYFTFGDQRLCKTLYLMWQFLKDHEVTVGELWNYLCAFHTSNKNADELYTFLMGVHKEHKDEKGYSYEAIKNSGENIIKLENEVISYKKHSFFSDNEVVNQEIKDAISYEISNNTIDKTYELNAKGKRPLEFSLLESLQELEKCAQSNKNFDNASHKKVKSTICMQNTNLNLTNDLSFEVAIDKHQKQCQEQKISDFFLKKDK